MCLQDYNDHVAEISAKLVAIMDSMFEKSLSKVRGGGGGGERGEEPGLIYGGGGGGEGVLGLCSSKLCCARRAGFKTC